MMRLTNTTLCIAAGGPKEKGFWKRGSSLELAPCLRVKNQMWYVYFTALCKDFFVSNYAHFVLQV